MTERERDRQTDRQMIFICFITKFTILLTGPLLLEQWSSGLTLQYLQKYIHYTHNNINGIIYTTMFPSVYT